MSTATAARRGGFPPGPGRVASARWLARFFDDPVPWFGELQRTYGDLVGLRAGPLRMIVAFDEALIERLLVGDARLVDKGHAVRTADFVIGNGLITANGEVHRRNRRIAAPVFSPRNVEPFAESAIGHVRTMLDAWPADGVVRAADEARDLSLRIAGTSLFGVEFDDAERRRIHRAMAALHDSFRIVTLPAGRVVVERGLTRAARRVRAARDEVDAIVRAMISERRRTGDAHDRSDLLSRLLGARDADDGSGFDDEQVRDEALTLLLAGHDTTAAALSWSLVALAVHDEARVRVHDELDRVLGPTRAVEAEDVAALPVLRAFVDEVLRLYPMGYSTARAPIEPIDAGDGVVLRPETDVVIPFGWLSRDPRWWDDPLRFSIDRFLAPGSAARAARPRVAYIPFGLGPRVCIGASFAMQTLLLAVASIARSYDLSLAPGTGPPRPSIGIIRSPAGPVPVRARRRDRTQ